MKRNNISYVKPQDPSFLAKLKAQIGYQEGPDLDTKRPKEDVAAGDDSDSEGSGERPERADEKPQIVVLRSGDLTAEEVAKEEARITLEAATAPADLSKPIVFKKRSSKPKETQEAATKGGNSSTTSGSSSSKANTTAATNKEKSSKKESSTKLLSFNFDDDDKDVEEED